MICLVPALPAPLHFDLDATVRSSWLAGLAPLSYDPARRCLRLAWTLPGQPEKDDRAVDLCLVQEPGQPLRLLGEGVEQGDLPALLPRLRAMLRLDEDLGLFYQMTDQDPDLRWVRQAGQGRILRAPTAAEDLIKALLCGTGSADLGRALCARLCTLLGARTSQGAASFPHLGRLAAEPLSFYEQALRAGRLARPLHRLIQRCHRGFYPEAIRRVELPAPRLAGGSQARKEHLEQERDWAERIEAVVHSLPGLGSRATALMMPLCGCYNAVSVSLSLRVAWSRRYPRRGRGLSERDLNRQIAGRVSEFSPYRGLALWLLVHGRAEGAADRPIQIAA